MLWRWLRRQWRAFLRTLAEVDAAVKICGAVFAAVIIVSTIVYHYAANKGLPHGFFRTISVMATGADMHEEELVSPWHKMFVGSLRLAGAALTGAFTAIVTNYLLRARLSGAIDVGRIPDSGHVVVCGLGQRRLPGRYELLHYGERVVVTMNAATIAFRHGAGLACPSFWAMPLCTKYCSSVRPAARAVVVQPVTNSLIWKSP